MLKSKNRTAGRKYNRGRYWIQQRDKCFARAGDRCEISGEPLRFELAAPESKPAWLRVFYYKRAVDHLFSERYIRRFIGNGADPHILENLYCITPQLHARKLKVERSLYSGDWLSFCSGMIRLGWSQEQLDRALKALCESARK